MQSLRWWEVLAVVVLVLLTAVAGALFIQVAIAQGWRWVGWAMWGLVIAGLLLGSHRRH